MSKADKEIRLHIRKVKNGYAAMFAGGEFGMQGEEFIGETLNSISGTLQGELKNRLIDALNELAGTK